ncbi:putative Heterokaryon incompatibility domain-containing protein [Seiridium unicorne]|uniref:Heterokaryon incompatibility domain-containing protein n=1 Tax=Seiridium unicorne TaxID=138068 RepID=A0ABR2UHD3_9PEZI
MRLMKTGTLEIRDFFGDQIPKYAILSHTWGEEETTLQDMQLIALKRQQHHFMHKLGYLKVKSACNSALAEGYEWVWVDTCCIDKTSSADLSEAINSMYLWYKAAAVCYVYLADYLQSASDRLLEKSRWFTRGWTLQELIAPACVEFYDGAWKRMGT